jgi:hypothetical protein
MAFEICSAPFVGTLDKTGQTLKRPTMSPARGLNSVRIIRQVPASKRGSNMRHSFSSYFKGFQEVPAVREIFGQQTDEVLASVQVEFLNVRSDYIWVSDKDGHMIANANYLKHGETRAIYLDVIHELVHVKQFRDGRKISLDFGERFEYVNRPSELEAYRHTVKEARRLGMGDDEIVDYLKVSWLDEDEVRHLARQLGVKIPRKKTKENSKREGGNSTRRSRGRL